MHFRTEFYIPVELPIEKLQQMEVRKAYEIRERGRGKIKIISAFVTLLN